MSSLAAAQNEIEQSYEEVPYEGLAYAQTHPAHLHVIATLCGLKPPDFKTAKVLELGCATGGNILPLALLYPKAHFTGIDLSSGQIAEARRQKETLKLGNIDFRAEDVMNFDVAAHKEKFDYIIAHGLLSWVPPPVQDRVMEICGACLSPRGLAVISFNTLPGWNNLRSLREMMMYHTRPYARLADKAKHARALLHYLAQRVPENIPGHRGLVESTHRRFAEVDDFYICHEYLEETNYQFYFHEFMEKAQARGLDYVGDGGVSYLQPIDLGLQALSLPKDADDIVTQEQYKDFIINRQFRTAIVCRRGQKVAHTYRNDQIMDYFLTATGGWSASSDDPRQIITFRHTNGAHFTSTDALANALFLELLACGQTPVAANELIRRAQKNAGLPQPRPLRDVLVAQGMPMVMAGFITLHADCPDHVTEVSEKPAAFPYARLQAEKEHLNVAINVLRFSIPCAGVDKIVLKNLDGTKTVDDLVHILKEVGKTADAQTVRAMLQGMARLGLLVR